MPSAGVYMPSFAQCKRIAANIVLWTLIGFGSVGILMHLINWIFFS